METDANTLLLVKFLVNAATTIVLVIVLVVYELFRKWDQRESEAKGLSVIIATITRYRVAWIIASILVPNWFEIVPKLFGAG